jgi:oligoribonuclease NrnB/cAMP/cGMP phosphodiesterase (DHH superfamily)
MKTVCVYHSIDLDGWMSAAIVKHWWNNMPEMKSSEDKLDFIGYNYGQPIPDLSSYEKVIMVDISFPVSHMVLLRNKLIWIDHHISAINSNKGVHGKFPEINGLTDTKFAACELIWKYFFPNENMPEIVRLLGRYDCFGHKGTDEELKVLEFQYGARQCITNYEDAYNYLHNCLIQEGQIIENSILLNGKCIYEYLCTDAKQSYKNGFSLFLREPLSTCIKDPSDFPERKFICINKERFNPINFGIDYHADGYDGAACFNRRSDGNWTFSLYNDNGLVDCSVIAKTFGGGGHKGAAGFVTKNIEQIIN